MLPVNEYRNDWIRFRSDHSFVKLFPLTNTPFPVTDPEYCHQLFKLLTWESAFFSSESEANITHLLRVLFSKLREGTKMSPRVFTIMSWLHCIR